MEHAQILNIGDIIMTFFAFLFLIIIITVFSLIIRYIIKSQLNRIEEKIDTILEHMYNKK